MDTSRRVDERGLLDRTGMDSTQMNKSFLRSKENVILDSNFERLVLAIRQCRRQPLDSFGSPWPLTSVRLWI